MCSAAVLEDIQRKNGETPWGRPDPLPPGLGDRQTDLWSADVDVDTHVAKPRAWWTHICSTADAAIVSAVEFRA